MIERERERDHEDIKTNKIITSENGDLIPPYIRARVKASRFICFPFRLSSIADRKNGFRNIGVTTRIVLL